MSILGSLRYPYQNSDTFESFSVIACKGTTRQSGILRTMRAVPFVVCSVGSLLGVPTSRGALLRLLPNGLVSGTAGVTTEDGLRCAMVG